MKFGKKKAKHECGVIRIAEAVESYECEYYC